MTSRPQSHLPLPTPTFSKHSLPLYRHRLQATAQVSLKSRESSPQHLSHRVRAARVPVQPTINRLHQLFRLRHLYDQRQVGPLPVEHRLLCSDFEYLNHLLSLQQTLPKAAPFGHHSLQRTGSLKARRGILHPLDLVAVIGLSV